MEAEGEGKKKHVLQDVDLYTHTHLRDTRNIAKFYIGATLEEIHS